jgi:disulfide bond formation protein DsbB
MNGFDKMTMRRWFAMTALCCAALLGFALFKQVQDYLEPCPLCIFQRVAFFAMGLVALLAAIHGPQRTGQWVYTGLFTLAASFGVAVSGRHVWLQSLPPDQVPECGPGLNYMLENFPLSETLSTIINGSGSCAEVDWTFLSLSMPWWTLIWYCGLGLLTLWLMFTRKV